MVGSGFAVSVYSNHYETYGVMDIDFYQVKQPYHLASKLTNSLTNQ